MRAVSQKTKRNGYCPRFLPLGVSRPYLIKLLEAGDLPFHKAGSHRRVYLKDLVDYQKRRDAERKAALNRIAKEAFESGLYDRTSIPEGGEDE